MKSKKGILSFITVFSVLLFSHQTTYSDTGFIIKFKEGANKITVQNTLQKLNLRMYSVFEKQLSQDKNKMNLLSANQTEIVNELIRYYSLRIPANIDTDYLYSAIKIMPDIEYIEPNYVFHIEENSTTPNDPLYPQQWALKAVGAEKAWEKATGQGVIVGVIDTGIDFLHEDLKDNLWINAKEDLNQNGTFEQWAFTEVIGGLTGDLNGLDDDGNGFIDDIIGYDFVDQSVKNVGDDSTPDPVPDDEHGHGTSVSGIIAAKADNSKLIAGLAYNSKIMTLRAFDATGNGESDDIAAAIVYAALQGAKALNFSFGELYPSRIMHDAIRFASSMGCFMAASSGNNNAAWAHYPSDFDEVVSVGASNSKGRRGSMSNYGSKLCITAPGENVLTTTLYNSSSVKSGTSFSAPHVVAAAALLYQIEPGLSPEDVRGILEVSAADAGDAGWDIYFGAGILNAGAAVNITGSTDFHIDYPPNDLVINKNTISQITVSGSIMTPMFNSFEVFIGAGETPDNWTQLVQPFFNQISNDTITVINTSGLQDTVYTIRILVNLKNNNTVERRKIIRIVSGQSPLRILSLRTINAFFNEQRVVLLAVETNRNSLLSVKFREKGSAGDYTEITDYNKLDRFHVLVIDSKARAGAEMEAIASTSEEAASPGIVTKADSAFTFVRIDETFPESRFREKDYGFPRAHIINNAKSLYNDDKPCLVVNDISSGDWGQTKIYQFDNNNFFCRDSLNRAWVPKDVGDSNGDGIQEIMATAYKTSILYQSKAQGGSPFSSVIFADTLSGNLWASQLYDVDKDGKEDLICYSDTAFYVYSYKSAIYNLLATADPKPPYKDIGTSPGGALGDFDGDGNIELCFGNFEGNVFIYEFSNGAFRQEFVDASASSYSDQYMCAADVDGDSIPEVLIGNYGTKATFGKDDAGDPVWQFKLLKSTGFNQYNCIWTDYVYGVRSGLEYKDGIAAGNIDNIPGDEIIISTFPNLYVLHYDTSKQEMKPLWRYPYSYSNSAITYDFDGNGINDLGFTTFAGTRFFEYNANFEGPATPLNFDGWAVDENSAFFKWNKVENAEYYELFRFVTETSAERVAETNLDSITTFGLENNNYYRFAVRAVNPSLQDTASDISNVIEVFTHAPIEPLKVIVHDEKTLLVSFSGRLPDKTIESSNFNAEDSGNNIFIPISALKANDTTLLLSFAATFQSGDYNLKVDSFLDYYRTPSLAAVLEFHVDSTQEKNKELFLKSLEVLSQTELLLAFSEPVELATSSNINNYSLRPSGNVTTISPAFGSPSQVKITLNADSRPRPIGNNYTLTVINVKAQSGANITKGAGNTLGFVLFADNLNDVYVYPNPIRNSREPQIFFANLTPLAHITIMTLQGELIKTLDEADSNGGVEWDGRDKSGKYLSPGIYIFKVEGTSIDGGERKSELKKLMVLP